MIKNFVYRPQDQKIYMEEFSGRLPEHIIDGHVHCFSGGCLDIPPEEFKIHKQYKPWTDFDFMPEFTPEDFAGCAASLFPDKRYQGVFFGLPFPQVSRIRCNEYILEEARKHQLAFYYIPGQYEDAREVEAKYHLLEQPGFIGWKPYPDLAVPKAGEEVRILDMLPESFLEMAEQYHLAVMLHLPGKGRLHSQRLRGELDGLIRRYKNVRFIIAHAGRAFCYYDIEGTIDFLLDRENVWFDTALLNDPTVLEYLMRCADKERIIFGSDAPLAFTRGKDICVNNRHYYVSGEPVPWGLYPGKAVSLELTYYLYEEIRAILYASKRVYGDGERDVLKKVMHDNMHGLMKN